MYHGGHTIRIFSMGPFALILMVIAVGVRAQVPALGWCPDYVPMSDFDVDGFLGRWYEAERYFTVSELGTRCVATDYTKAAGGRIHVSNHITNRITNVQRTIAGTLQELGKSGEGRLSVRYQAFPVPYDTQYTVLDTDYDSFAVLWSCNGIGPVHTQNAWVYTRERRPPGSVLQKAYGVLDKYRLTRTLFLKTEQDSCGVEPDYVDQKKVEIIDVVREVEENVKAAEPEKVIGEVNKEKLKEVIKEKVEEKLKEKKIEVVKNEQKVKLVEPEKLKEQVVVPEVEKKVEVFDEKENIATN